MHADQANTAQVNYFKERRIVEAKKAAMYKNLEKEGAQPLGQTLPGIANSSAASAASGAGGVGAQR